MADLDLRKLRYFVTVAEERNYGRAAARLHIAQPVLSRQISALEGELGVVLFERSKAGTVLTEAGESLLSEAAMLLSHSTALTRRARVLGRGTKKLTIGFMPGIIVTQLTRQLVEQFPDLVVDVVRTTWDNQTAVVHDGSVDISLVRLPVDGRGLALLPLFSESRLVAVPTGHPLADEESVTIEQLAPFDLLQDPDAVPEWRDAAACRRPGALAGCRSCQARQAWSHTRTASS